MCRSNKCRKVVKEGVEGNRGRELREENVGGNWREMRRGQSRKKLRRKERGHKYYEGGNGVWREKIEEKVGNNKRKIKEELEFEYVKLKEYGCIRKLEEKAVEQSRRSLMELEIVKERISSDKDEREVVQEKYFQNKKK